jgi:hypothetical protein
VSSERSKSAPRRRLILIVSAVVSAGATTVAQRLQVSDRQAKAPEPALEILWQYDTKG